MDATTIAGLTSSLSSATQIVKAVLGMKIDSDVKAAISDLQSSLISAQGAALESLAERDQLQTEVRELRAKLAAKEEWAEIEGKFSIEQTPLAHAYKSDDFPGLYCPKCFENKRLSKLQETRYENGSHSGECLQCETKLKFVQGRIQTPPRRSNWMA